MDRTKEKDTSFNPLSICLETVVNFRRDQNDNDEVQLSLLLRVLHLLVGCIHSPSRY